MNKEELEEAINILKNPVTVTTERYYYFKEEDYNKLEYAFHTAQRVIDYIELLINKEG
jgi:hypothetical protein